MSEKKELPTVEGGPSGERCETCYFWECGDDSESETRPGVLGDAIANHDRFGWCHRYPPRFPSESRCFQMANEGGTVNGLHQIDDHPLTYTSSWCGEWKAKPEPEESPPAPRGRVEIQFPESDFSVAVDVNGLTAIRSDLIRPVTERAKAAMRAVGRVNSVAAHCVLDFAWKWFGVAFHPTRVSLTTRHSFRVETLPPLETIFLYILDRDGEEYDLTDTARTTIESAVNHLRK